MQIKKGVWHAGRLAEALGWPGIVGAGLLAGLVATWPLLVTPLQARIAMLKTEVGLLRSRTAAKLPAEHRPLSSAEQLREFHRFFPAEDSIPDAMAKLHSAAAQYKLGLEQGEYHLLRDRDSRLGRYEILLPVRGAYSQIRKFVAQSLTDVPSLSLDSFTISRQKAADPLVDAQLKFTLYLAAE